MLGPSFAERLLREEGKHVRAAFEQPAQQPFDPLLLSRTTVGGEEQRSTVLPFRLSGRQPDELGLAD